MSEFDAIAKEYTDTEGTRLERTHVIDPCFLGAVGSVRGKSVLDLACGGGKFSRIFKKEGAREVVGVDISSEMIKIAKKKAKEENLEIKYLVGDVSNMGKIGEFDLVAAAFLFHYSKTKAELLGMCKNVSANLKKGGRFVTLNINPFNPISSWEDKELGIKIEGPKKLKEGDPIKYTLSCEGKESCSFKNYYWSKETYEKFFRDVGFTRIRWIPLQVPIETLRNYPYYDWKKITENPRLIMIELIK